MREAQRAMTMASRVSLSSFLVVFCLLALALTGIYAEGEESKSKEFVVSLDQSNFTDFVSKHDFIVVEFYAPWYDVHLALPSCIYFDWSKLFLVLIVICVVRI